MLADSGDRVRQMSAFVGLDGFVDEFESELALPGLMQQHAKKVICVCVIRRNSENLTVEDLCFHQVTTPVELHCERERVGKTQLRDLFPFTVG